MGLLLKLLLELLLLLLYAFYHVLTRGREAPPIIHSTILIPGFGGTCSVRSSLGLRLALHRALLARQEKKNAIGSPIALQLAFFRPTWLVRALSGRSRHAPGLNFRGRNEGFLDVCAFGYARFCTTS